MFIVTSHNTINSCCALASTTHSQTLMEKGSSVQNTKTVRLLSLQIIGKANLLLLLQSGNDKFLIHRIRLGEHCAINWLTSKSKKIIIFLAEHLERLLGKTRNKSYPR